MPQSHVEVVGHDWNRFDELLELSYVVLYEPFGVPRDSEWYQPAHGSEFVVALGGEGGLLGTARLLPSSDPAQRQVRQVVVSPTARERGVGRQLMTALETLALEEGAAEMWLHARCSAYGFYERLGYEREGEEFASELTGIAHTTMRKRLGRGAVR